MTDKKTFYLNNRMEQAVRDKAIAFGFISLFHLTAGFRVPHQILALEISETGATLVVHITEQDFILKIPGIPLRLEQLAELEKEFDGLQEYNHADYLKYFPIIEDPKLGPTENPDYIGDEPKTERGNK